MENPLSYNRKDEHLLSKATSVLILVFDDTTEQRKMFFFRCTNHETLPDLFSIFEVYFHLCLRPLLMKSSLLFRGDATFCRIRDTPL